VTVSPRRLSSQLRTPTLKPNNHNHQGQQYIGTVFHC